MQWRSPYKKGFSRKNAPVLELPGVGGIPAIPLQDVKIDAWKSTCELFVTIPVWFAYLFITSILWTISVPAALLSIFFIGQYMVAWMGYLRHELWHNYFPGVNNPIFFKSICYMLFSDPKIYEIAHTTHHRDLHTVRDIEFCCRNYATSSFRRRFHFILELLLGNIGWEATTMIRMTWDGQITVWRTVWSLSVRLALLVAYCFLADWIYPGSGKVFTYVYALTIWVGSLITRHDQWIEHLGIVSDAPLADRVRMVRNLPDSHWTNRIWNIFNHNDPRNHYFHHAYPQMNFREAEGLELPEDAVKITIPQYLRFLWQYYKSI